MIPKTGKQSYTSIDILRAAFTGQPPSPPDGQARMLAKIDLGTIQKSIRDSTPITFRLITFTHDHHAMMDRVIEVFLTELGQERFLEPLAYCVRS